MDWPVCGRTLAEQRSCRVPVLGRGAFHQGDGAGEGGAVAREDVIGEGGCVQLELGAIVVHGSWRADDLDLDNALICSVSQRSQIVDILPFPSLLGQGAGGWGEKKMCGKFMTPDDFHSSYPNAIICYTPGDNRLRKEKTMAQYLWQTSLTASAWKGAAVRQYRGAGRGWRC